MRVFESGYILRLHLRSRIEEMSCVPVNIEVNIAGTIIAQVKVQNWLRCMVTYGTHTINHNYYINVNQTSIFCLEYFLFK